MGFAKVTIAGNIVRDIEAKTSSAGTTYLSNAIAWDRWSKGEKTVNYLDFSVFGQTADIFAQYVRKGQKILLHGNLEQEAWTDRDTGQRKFRYRMIVEDFEFISSREKAPQQPAQPVQQAQPQQQQLTPDSFDDVPF